jgi:hypothetical protein
MTTMDLSIRVAFSAIDKLTRPVSAASKAIGGLSDSLKKTQSSIKDLEKAQRHLISCARKPMTLRRS